MTQSAAIRPEPTFQRKAAIAHGGAVEHTGRVSVVPIPDFDLNKTIFQTLEGTVARYVIRQRIAKSVSWPPPAAAQVQTAYDAVSAGQPLPDVNPELLRFLVEACNFDVEHADGSFLDHLYFCFEYGARHYPHRSPVVLLLHSILGTGTNTFAMDRVHIPALQALVSPFEWTHIEAFPSVLRLLYSGEIRRELRENTARAQTLRKVRMHRVIDNTAFTLSGEDFWIALNYQLIHLVDFMPAANWTTHQNDTAYIVLRDLYDLLTHTGQLEARVTYTPPRGGSSVGETIDFGGWLTTRIPVGVSERMASQSVQRFSRRIGHDLTYEMTWS